MSSDSATIDNLRRLAGIVPRFRKERFLRELSEDDFRDRVVRPIFLRRGYTDGRETCGVDEHGKDCYFTKHSELTGIEVTVVQTKKGKITKAGTKPHDNLDALVAQLRTALTSRVVLLPDKIKKSPAEAILVASGEINSHARNHIYDELQDARLKFVDVETLIPLIDRDLPELWLDIDSDAISYFREISRAVEHGGELIAGGVVLAQENNNAAILDDGYAPIHVIRSKPKPTIKGQKKPKKSDKPSIGTAFPATSLTHERERLILLVGGGGSGKSTALKRIAYDLARRIIESQSEVRVPILLRARDLASAPSLSLLDHAIVSVRRLNPSIKQPFTSDDLEKGRVIFMIDGLDEIPKTDQADAVLDLILQLHVQYHDCQILVASRSTEYIRASEKIKPFVPYSIADLSLVQAEKIIHAVSRRESLSPEACAEILRQLQQIHGITLSPLIVTIFVATSDVTRPDVPPNITELFKKYTELVLGRWDESKKLHQQIQAPVKDLVLQQVSLRMHRRRTLSLPLDEFRAMVQEELASRGFVDESSFLYDEIVNRSGLFRIYSDRIEFRHLLFQEFFAGRAMKDVNDIAGVIEDDWWKRAVVFFFGEHPKDIESLITLADSLKNRSGSAAFNAATTIGLSLQACYFAELGAKEQVYSNVVRAIVNAMSDEDFVETLAACPIIRLLLCFLLARESLALSNLKAVCRPGGAPTVGPLQE